MIICFKAIVRTHRQTHLTDCCIWTTEVVCIIIATLQNLWSRQRHNNACKHHETMKFLDKHLTSPRRHTQSNSFILHTKTDRQWLRNKREKSQEFFSNLYSRKIHFLLVVVFQESAMVDHPVHSQSAPSNYWHSSPPLFLFLSLPIYSIASYCTR